MTEFVLRRRSFGAGQGFVKHHHGHDHAIAVEAGAIEIVYGGKTWRYGEGEIAVMRAGVIHSVRALDEGTELALFHPMAS